MDLLALPRAAVATTLGAATALRGARVFHPYGAVHEATVTVAGGLRTGASLLDRPGVHDGVVRLSRGIGLPAPLPDVEGLALRLPGLGVGGAPLDLLINSAWRFAFAPSALTPTWSAVLPHRTGSGETVLLGARPHQGGFTLLAAPLLGAWRSWGELAVGTQLPGDVSFDPTLGAEDLRHGELFRQLRRWSYDASQAARQAPVGPAQAPGLRRAAVGPGVAATQVSG